MSRTKHIPYLIGFPIVVILFGLITISHSFQNPYPFKKCAELFSQDGFGGLKLEMMDQDHSLNLAANYKVSNGWNTISSIKIENGCSMSLCNETYLDGECKSIPAGFYGSSQLKSIIGYTNICIGQVYMSKGMQMLLCFRQRGILRSGIPQRRMSNV
ncbi:unnamed protein product [Orchesella dallaii]|uniref:Uncharacterized protein n=1 Tax=Orchesella dallaii TaxID=48710 RepID=A0ABP1PKJ7_9HEXA